MTEKKRGLFHKALGTNAIKDVFSHTKGMLKDIKPSKKQYIKETFDEAMKRHGVKEVDENKHLLKVYKNLKVQFLVFTFGQIWLIVFGVISNFLEGDYFISLTYLFLTFALLTLSTQYGLRCYQIREKHLGMLGKFFKSPSQWYPRKITEEKLLNTKKEI